MPPRPSTPKTSYPGMEGRAVEPGAGADGRSIGAVSELSLAPGDGWGSSGYGAARKSRLHRALGSPGPPYRPRQSRPSRWEVRRCRRSYRRNHRSSSPPLHLVPFRFQPDCLRRPNQLRGELCGLRLTPGHLRIVGLSRLDARCRVVHPPIPYECSDTVRSSEQHTTRRRHRGRRRNCAIAQVTQARDDVAPVDNHIVVTLAAEKRPSGWPLPAFVVYVAPSGDYSCSRS